MDRERLNILLQEPTAVDAADVAGLRELAGRYPWFSGAQVLLTVGEAATGGVLYDEHLRQVAAHLPSRARVHDLVHADAGPAPRLRPTPVDAGPLTVPVTPEPPVPMREPVDQEPAVGTPGEPVASADGPAPPAPRPEGSIAASDELDDQIRSAALATAYDLTWSAPPPAKEVLGPVVPRTEAPAPPPAPTPAPPPPTIEEPAVPAPRRERMRFTAWLENGPSEGTRASSTSPKEDRVPAPPPEAPVKQASPPPVLPGAMDTTALIERFIQGQAPPAPRKAEFFTPQQAAKRSLEEHAELVTETLARIYEQQGDTARAAAAYKRLAERHPQRRDEFLARAAAVERGKG